MRLPNPLKTPSNVESPSGESASVCSTDRQTDVEASGNRERSTEGRNYGLTVRGLKLRQVNAIREMLQVLGLDCEVIVAKDKGA